jgi:hypothetical protein
MADRGSWPAPAAAGHRTVISFAPTGEPPAAHSVRRAGRANGGGLPFCDTSLLTRIGAMA